MSVKHVAIIPDGNRRWARRRGYPSGKGHEMAKEVFKEISEKALELEIPYLTFWIASVDNLTKRTKEEVRFLIKVITEEFQRLLEENKLKQKKVRVRILGQFRRFVPPKTLRIIEKLIKRTEKYNLFFLTFLFAYDGREEMKEAIKRVVEVAKKGTLEIGKETIKNFLWTKDLPPVDLVIRTGCEGDPHNSAGFMMWHTAYSQYYFTDTLFPDFSPKEFEKAVKGFLRRERRLGE